MGDIADLTDGQTTSTASIRYRLPTPALRDVIANYHFVTVAGVDALEDQLFPAWANFRWSLTGEWQAQFPNGGMEPVPAAGVSGTLERSLRIRGMPGLLVGVGLTPQGWIQLTDAPIKDFANQIRPLADALGPLAGVLHDRLGRVAPLDINTMVAILDESFVEIMRIAPEADFARRAHSALQDRAIRSVAAWASRLEVSRRQLERISLKVFGVPPKGLLRRQRVLRTLEAMMESPLGAWAYFLDDQYVDRPHFIREFRHYVTHTPKAYLNRPSALMAEAWRSRKSEPDPPVQGPSPIVG